MSSVPVAAAVLMLLAFSAGCISDRIERRTVVVRVVTDPPGAVVEVTDAAGMRRNVGRSPVNFEATYAMVRHNAVDHNIWWWMAIPSLVFLGGTVGLFVGVDRLNDPCPDDGDPTTFDFNFCLNGLGEIVVGSSMMGISAAAIIIMGSVFGYYDQQDDEQPPEYLPFFVRSSLEGYEGRYVQVHPTGVQNTVELKLEPLISEELPAHGEVPLNEDQERQPEPGQDQQPAQPVESEQGEEGES